MNMLNKYNIICVLQFVAVHILAGRVCGSSIASAHLHPEQRDSPLLPQQLLRQVAQQLPHSR